jgi:hypothetical protein
MNSTDRLKDRAELKKLTGLDVDRLSDAIRLSQAGFELSTEEGGVGRLALELFEDLILDPSGLQRELRRLWPPKTTIHHIH